VSGYVASILFLGSQLFTGKSTKACPWIGYPYYNLARKILALNYTMMRMQRELKGQRGKSNLW